MDGTLVCEAEEELGADEVGEPKRSIGDTPISIKSSFFSIVFLS